MTTTSEGDGSAALTTAELNRSLRQQRKDEHAALYQSIAKSEAEHEDASVDIARVETEIGQRKAELDELERYLNLQQRRRSAIELRIKADREMLRAHEDYTSNAAAE